MFCSVRSLESGKNSISLIKVSTYHAVDAAITTNNKKKSNTGKISDAFKVSSDNNEKYILYIELYGNWISFCIKHKLYCNYMQNRSLSFATY